MYTLEIKLNDNVDPEIVEYYRQLGEKVTTDSGIDLVTTQDYEISPFALETFNFDIKCQMIKDNNSFSPYYLYPRSSISKTPLIMANCVGIIDSDYRGNIMAKVRNVPLDVPCKEKHMNYNVKKGTRLFQLCAPDLSPLKVRIVNELSETSRNEGGFGSTGLTIDKVV